MGRTADDLRGHGAGHERSPARRRARTPAPLTLVLHPGALGDVLLAIPALRALRQRWPDAPLTLAAQPRIGELLTTLGVVQRCVAFDSLGLDALFGDPGGAHLGWPDRCAVDLRRASRIVSWFGAGDHDFVGRLTTLIPCAVVARSVGGEGLVWEHLLRTVAARATPLREPIAIPSSVADAGRRELERVGWEGKASVLLVHPGGGGRAKRWPAQGFASAIQSLPQSGDPMVVVHRGPADGEAVGILRPLLRRRTAVLEEPSLITLAGVLSHASAYLGNDSGISHLAAALGVRSVVLFTAEHVAWQPWASQVESLTVSTGTAESADVDRVRRAVRALIGRRAG